ncbi:hypothetical protein [Nesterenkonia ebinurensis]|uniref:hypothetical protein n=1 Tax=Nesterenkonia ebinurensis TaxID=2608252 RepID=UPI00123DE424|nr:hypothetical protein [Nesterenkonia ebinurensis]
MHHRPEGLSWIRHTPMIATAVITVVSLVIALFSDGEPEPLVPLLLIPALLPPILVERWARVHIPFSMQAGYAVLLITGPYIGEFLGLYHAWDPWDKVVHTYSGFPLALLVVFALGITIRRYNLQLPPWLEAAIIITVKGFIALLWEVAEFIWDAVFDTSAQDNNWDTMTDMILGSSPGVLVAAMLLLHRSGRLRSGYLDFLLNCPQPRTTPPQRQGS